METPSRYTFSPDGNTKVFPIPVTMKGDNYVRIDINGSIINDRNKFDIVNNAIVFVDVADVPAGSTLDVLVVQTDEGIANLGTVNAIDIVSQNIAAVNTVSTNIAGVNTAASNITAIANVNSNMPAITGAVAAATDAENSKNAAAASATAAANSETAAASSASTASGHASSAATSLANATAAELAAIQASADADTAKNAAQTSATNAANSASAASTSASNASGSASAAASSVTTATTKANEAAASAAAAAADVATIGTSVTDAAASATAAQNSAVAASNSQTAAAASAAAAAAAYDTFDDRYLGSYATDPTLDNDGDPLVRGALYFSSTANEMRVYDGANWIAATSAGGASLENYRYIATGGQTAFSGADVDGKTLVYTVENLIVTLNGVNLYDGVDYTATDGTTITLTAAANANDEITVLAFKSFTTADMVSATNGGTFQNNVTVNGVLTATQVDSADFYVDVDTGLALVAPATAGILVGGTQRAAFTGTGVDVTGDITLTGTVDGRDIAADGTKLDSINQGVATTDSPTFVTLNATTVDLGNWTVTESAGVLYFATGGVNKMKLDASGNLTVTGDVTAFGSV